jgi:rod shape determining protein RodA
MKFDRRLFFNFDWVLLVLVLFICVLGILNIYSAGFSLTDERLKYLYLKQLQWTGIGLLFMALAFSIDYRILTRHAYVIYLVCLILLILVFVVGYATRGSQRWIVCGGFSFQPSELMKVAVILALAKYFDDHKSEKGYLLRELAIPFAIVFIPFLFILKQPDMGTGLVLMILFLSVIFIVGMKWESMLAAACCGFLLIPISWLFFKDYQKERIMTFFDPQRDPLGAGYHIIQSIIAVGSGGLLGKGFLKGTQTQLKFLPEQQTDFVFSVFAEEWGFLGGMILMLLFLALIFWGLKIAVRAKDLSGKLISFGISMLIFWQVFINIGMVLGILPVVGIPLPFMSYGGSSMVVLMTGVGLLLNVRMRRFVLQPSL